ncbi:MAG: adenylate kinase [Acidimicrobiales bacterium]
MASGYWLVIFGKQGAGKGTQCARLASRFGVDAISTGEMLREAVRSGTEFGRKADEFMRIGELVPDDVMVGLVEERLAEKPTLDSGFILDGFPRTRYQAEQLGGFLAPRGVDLVLVVDVPTEMVLERLASRRVCSDCGANYSLTERPARDWACDVCGGPVVQRDDDTEVAILRRLEVYEAQTAPLIAYYMAQDKLATIDGTGSPDGVTARLVKAVESRVPR